MKLKKLKTQGEINLWFSDNWKKREEVFEALDLRVFWKLYKKGLYIFNEDTLSFKINALEK